MIRIDRPTEMKHTLIEWRNEMLFVICYDIESDRRRVRVHRALQSYGYAIQESVFEVQADAAQWERLTKRLGKILESPDKIRYYFICEACVGKRAGMPPPEERRASSAHIL